MIGMRSPEDVAAAHLGQRRQAVDFGHHHIKQNEVVAAIRVRRLECIDRFFSGGCAIDGQRRTCEQCFEQIEIARFVIDNEHSLHRRREGIGIGIWLFVHRFQTKRPSFWGIKATFRLNVLIGRANGPYISGEMDPTLPPEFAVFSGRGRSVWHDLRSILAAAATNLDYFARCLG